MEFYVILGVDQAASTADVKRAYRRLARKYHPDINPGDHEAEAFFRRVSEAYETLIDPDRRQDYDARGLLRETGSGAEVEFEGFDFSVSTTGDAASTFGDLFSDVLSGAEVSGERGGSPAGIDLQVTLGLGFDEAVRGGTFGVTVSRVAPCDACRGTGARRVAQSRCGACAGTGQARWSRGHMVFSRQCGQCAGTGRRQQRPCGVCRAEGIVSRTEAVAVPLPAGVADGTKVRIPGKGSAGRRGGVVGDLYVTVVVQPHVVFRRDGDDLHLVVPVAVHEAALGARIDVPTVDNRARVRIPPGTQAGQRLRLRGRGVPSPRTGEPGDLIVEVRIVLPEVSDERVKQLLRDLAELSTEDVRARLWSEVTT